MTCGCHMYHRTAISNNTNTKLTPFPNIAPADISKWRIVKIITTILPLFLPLSIAPAIMNCIIAPTNVASAIKLPIAANIFMYEEFIPEVYAPIPSDSANNPTPPRMYKILRTVMPVGRYNSNF